MNQNCEINREEIDNSIDNLQAIIDYMTYLMQTFYNIISLRFFADLLREKLGKD